MNELDKRTQHRNKLIRLRVRHLFLALSILTPILFFVALGVQAWWQFDNQWLLLLGLTMCSAVTGLAYKYLFRPKAKVPASAQEEFQPSNKKAWGPQEEQIWLSAKAEAIRRVELAPGIMEVVQRHPVALADFIAHKYGGKKKLETTLAKNLQTIARLYSRFYFKQKVIADFCDVVADY